MASCYNYVLQVDKYWSKQERIDSLENVTVEKLQSFIDNKYFSTISIESLLMGNLTVQGCCFNKITFVSIFLL